jgi:tetratricopeptide (TPR) repeat protein
MLVHNVRGTLANMRSQFDLAEALLRKGLAAARELGAPSAIGGMLCSLGVPLYYRGELSESAALTLEAARLYEMLGRIATATTVRGNLAAITLAQGELAAAREHAEIAVRLSRESGDEDALSGSLATLGDVLFQQGDLALARTTLEESVRLAEAIEQPLTLTEALYLLAGIDLRDNERDSALAHILRLRDVLSKHRLAVRVPMLVLAAADWAASAGGEHRDVARRWAQAIERLEDIDATLREKARRLLAREFGTEGDDEHDASLSLPELEREVVTFLAGV